MLELDNRKLRILAAIVEEYIRTGEPVGSRRVAELLGDTLSSATCRNEMAVLFGLGLLEQPHTSAGRIPSHMGFRVYLDQMLRTQPLSDREKDDIDALFNVRNPDPDRLMSDAAASLARFTGFATVSATTTPRHVTLRRIELIPPTPRTVMIMVQASSGVAKTRSYRLDFYYTPQLLDFFKKFASDRLVGRSLRELSTQYMQSVAVALGEYARVFTPLLAGIYELCREICDGLYHIHGSTNLLAFKEFGPHAHELLTLLESREKVTEALLAGGGAVSIRIGKENPYAQMEDTALLAVRYDIDRDTGGVIGVIGPVRLDYSHLIPHLEYFAKTLGNLLAESMGEADSADGARD